MAGPLNHCIERFRLHTAIPKTARVRRGQFYLPVWYVRPKAMRRSFWLLEALLGRLVWM